MTAQQATATVAAAMSAVATSAPARAELRQRDGSIVAVLGGDWRLEATEHRDNGWSVGDYAGLVALLNQGLAVLAHEVAAALGSLAAAGAAAE